MNKELFLILSITFQTLFLAADLVERRLTRGQRHNAQPLKFGSLLFLIGIIVLYGVIQVGGLALIPKTEILLAYIRGHLSVPAMFTPQAQTLTFVQWLGLGVAGFYIAGFWDYIVHRFLSHSRPLWFMHEYHHLPNELCLGLPGLCVRPFVVVAVLPSTVGTLLTMCAGLALLGYHSLPLMSLIYAVIFVQMLILLATHSSFFLRFDAIHHLLKYTAITTPQEHELHHTVDLKGNYGNFTVLWDRLFGTYLDPLVAENQNHPLGLASDQDFLGAITMGKLKLPADLREKFQVGRYCNIK
ncbi:MAG: sterol desaturase family protein, partial [Candidatus Omnitrophica bacterium]|nr:sterol desaturase family protein [Candidatus Omnitrophota bacterium]